jgi:hypothetical protein
MVVGGDSSLLSPSPLALSASCFCRSNFVKAGQAWAKLPLMMDLDEEMMQAELEYRVDSSKMIVNA